MWQLVMATLGELAHRALARLARVGDDGTNPRRFEEDALANAIARHLDVARLETRHHLGHDRETGDDDVGAIWIQPLDGASFGRLHGVQRLEQMLHVATGD